MRILRLIVPLLAVVALAAGALTLNQSVGAEDLFEKPLFFCMNPPCFFILCPEGTRVACLCDRDTGDCECRCVQGGGIL